MSGPIPGHGYRKELRVLPRCKCNWSGAWCSSEEDARGQFEGHKTRIREQTGYVPKGKHRRTDSSSSRRRAFRVVEGGG